MSSLEALLRVSLIQAELLRLADALGPKGARVVLYAARVLNLVRTYESGAPDP